MHLENAIQEAMAELDKGEQTADAAETGVAERARAGGGAPRRHGRKLETRSARTKLHKKSTLKMSSGGEVTRPRHPR